MRPDAKLAPGQVLGGRYRLVQQIGRGAMGSVWRAEEDAEGRAVALKVIRPRGEDGKTSPTAVGRFMREFRAMSRLRSPHVVHVYGHETDGELVFIAMEVLRGIDLRDRLKRAGKLDRATTLRVLRHVGRAVGLAHQLGIVHRDLKPANIFLASDQGGFVTKVLDFGMAKSVGMPLATLDPVLTELGRPIGTPYYMSPEQARGTIAVDHRSDLWAIGVLAFECLCGVRPFVGQSLAEVFTNIAAGSAPVPSMIADVPAGFDAWFARAVERDVQRRFQSAKLMLEELEEVLGDPPSSTLGPTSTSIDVTMSDMVETLVQPPGFGERTLQRRAPESSESFVGRTAELAALERAIEHHCRVLTVTGAPGSGRGRLVRELALRRAAELGGGCWHVDLHEARDATGMWLKLALSLGVRLDEGDAARRVGRALGGLGKILVVIEGADAVRDHLAPALARWLSDAPQALFALTAQGAIEAPTERVVPLHGLDLPDHGADRIDSLTRHAASELLLRRALSFDRRLITGEDHSRALARICHATGGHPLALELIAGCFDATTPEAILDALDGARVNLGGTAIIDPERTPEQVIGWRLRSLSPAERHILTQCKAFAGGFTVQAAEAVIEAPDDAPPVASLLERLVRRSLLQRAPRSWGEPRYGMHAAVAAQLPPPPAAALERHGRYYAQFGSAEALEALMARGGVLRRSRYDAEWDNLSAALARAEERRDGETTAAVALACAAVLQIHGRCTEAARPLLRAGTAEHVGAADRVRCLTARGIVLAASRRPGAAADALALADRAAGALDEADRAALARARARVELARPDFGRARQELAIAMDSCTRRGDLLGRADCQRALGELETTASSLELAARHLPEALSVYQSLGAPQREAETLGQLGLSLLALGRTAEAEARIESARSLHRELGNRHADAELCGLLGEAALDSGRRDQAERLLEQAAGRSRELGACDFEGRFLSALAALSHAQKAERASYLMQQAEQLARGDGGGEQLVVVLCRRAELEAASGWRERARATLREIDARCAQLDALAAARLRRRIERTRALAAG